MRMLYGSSFVIAVVAGLLLFVNTIVPLVVLGVFIWIGDATIQSRGSTLITELVPGKTLRSLSG
jgi:hypothetical protein